MVTLTNYLPTVYCLPIKHHCAAWSPTPYWHHHSYRIRGQVKAWTSFWKLQNIDIKQHMCCISQHANDKHSNMHHTFINYWNSKKVVWNISQTKHYIMVKTMLIIHDSYFILHFKHRAYVYNETVNWWKNLNALKKFLAKRNW